MKDGLSGVHHGASTGNLVAVLRLSVYTYPDAFKREENVWTEELEWPIERGQPTESFLFQNLNRVAAISWF